MGSRSWQHHECCDGATWADLRLIVEAPPPAVVSAPAPGKGEGKGKGKETGGKGKGKAPALALALVPALFFDSMSHDSDPLPLSFLSGAW